MARLLLALLLVLGAGIAHGQDWPAVREVELELAPGSPLDFSTIMPNGEIGPQRHLVVANGRFAMSDEAETPVPLLCATLGWSPASGGFPDKDEADRYARQLAMHGYNIARLHFLDANLMFGQAGDFDVDPDVFDRAHYLMAALKREGISWIIDGLTSARGGLGGYDDRWEGQGSLKQDVLLSAGGLEHWRRLQERILGTVNPYTGIAPIADPALAMIVLVNEGGLEFDSIVGEGKGHGSYSAEIVAGFNEWLKSRYADSASLAQAWGGLDWGESLEDETIRLPANRYAPAARFDDLQLYFLETERRGSEAMTAILRGMGYRGGITNYNNWPTLQASLSRQDLDVATMNVYFDWVAGYAPGTTIEQQSSLGRGLDYLRVAAATRWMSKPFILTEYDHLFWNQYRYEAGLAVPAFAAQQAWDGLCRHGHGPIVLRYGEDAPHKQQMLPYAIALDPVARAGETLSALLFRRGDVAMSGASVGFTVNGTNGLGAAIEMREPEDLTGLMAFARIGLVAQEDASGPAVPAQRDSTSFADMVERLRAAGALPEETLAALNEGSYLSSTGEIEVSPDRRLMTVVTQRTVAAAFTDLAVPLALGPATLQSSDGPALFAFSALDELPLQQSRRILLIFATDARNSGMRFADGEARVIADFGRLPVRIRPGTVTFRLAGEGKWKLSPVGLDGVVHPEVASGQGGVDVTLNNVTPQGPTTYFVLERG